MDDDFLSFEQHRRRQDDNPGVVRCAHCGKRIPATATRCPECQVHFQGEAQDYLHPSERPTKTRGIWLWVVAVLVLIGLLLSALGMR